MTQTVDKTKVFRQIDEGFGQAFSKACAVEGAQPSPFSAENGTLPGVSFCELFLCAAGVKEKVGYRIFASSQTVFLWSTTIGQR